jgi:hypothetical protein
MRTPASLGKVLEGRLRTHLRAVQNGPTDPGHERPIIEGVTRAGVCINGLTLDGFLAQAGRILIDSGRVYRWQDTLVYEFSEPDNQELQLLCVRGRAESHAGNLLSNLLAVGVRGEESMSQCLVPPGLVGALLADEGLWRRLPAIRISSRRAVYDDDFNLRGPGWHGSVGALVHGAAITPAELPPVTTGGRSVDRLPPHLGRLLGEFCWAEDADLENAVALLLTGILSNHFVQNPKPVGLLDGNQPEVGKSLLVQVIGHVLDGQEPERIPIVRDEELEKKVGAKLRESRSSIFFFDNIKTKIESEFIEANALSPLLCVRLLGHSRNITRPNSFLWLICSNQTSGSPDLVTRGVPVRLRWEGDPAQRTFRENPLEYAARHRLEILGELAGMVERWKQQGRPTAKGAWPSDQKPPRHRCQHWVEIVGGILAASGHRRLLTNLEDARADMDLGLQALAELAEHALSRGDPGFVNPPENDPERGRLPREWATLFQTADVCRDQLLDKNSRGRATWVGTFLSGKTDRAVDITVHTAAGATSGSAVLRRNKVRNDQKRYFFEITLAGGAEVTPPAPPGGVAGLVPQTPPPTGATTAPPGPAGPETGTDGSAGNTTSTAATGNDLQWV